MKYTVKYTSQFKRALKQAQKRGKDIEKLFSVIELLANDKVLPEVYREHTLSDNYAGCHECHIENDWLLVYEFFDDVMVLSLTALGTHSDFFVNIANYK